MEFIAQTIGLTVNAHLFRAVGAKVFLDAQPQAIETMRQVLAHTSSTTTIRAYAPIRTKHAFRNYDDVIEKRRRSAFSTQEATRK